MDISLKDCFPVGKIKDEFISMYTIFKAWKNPDRKAIFSERAQTAFCLILPEGH